ncbi:MAG: efflux RND transporter periplasmic adaptor subunit, partial [Acidobacteria bacterium]|nr:efflux RND transporter periplasmic adaptor subunit [Acidobacteriota bacterium]
MKRIIIVLVAVTIIAAALFFVRSGGATQPSPAAEKKPPVVETATVTRAPISEVLELTGTVEPYRLARVASVAVGPVATLHVREGQKVRAGTPLVIIGRRSGVDAAIGARREDLNKEEDNLRRTEQLVATDALPAEELDAARASYESARANLEGAAESGRDFTLRAPWSGTVSRVLVREGDFVSARSPVVELYDPSSLIVRAEVPERYAAIATEGLPVAIRLDAFPGRELDGVIQRTYPYLDERMRTKTIEIAIREPVELLPGMFARIEVQLSTVPDAIVVPREAVISKEGGSVFIMENG